MSVQPKHSVLREKLLEHIRGLPGGAKLPAVRELMSNYEVSQLTVERALSGLKKLGLVESRTGQGTFLCDSQAKSKSLDAEHQVELILFGGERTLSLPGFHKDLVDQLMRCLGKKHWSLRATVLPNDVDGIAFVDTIEKLSPRAAILMGPPHQGIAEILARRNIAFVLMFPAWSTDLPNSFVVDNRSVARCWVEHLAEHGHKHIAYIHAPGKNNIHPDINERMRFFYEEMAKRGLLPDPEIVLEGDFNFESGYTNTKKLLAGKKKFTAVVTNDHAASGVYKALNEAGLEVGRDVSVIGTDDLDWTDHMHPPLTTVRIPRKRLALQAIAELSELLKGGSREFPCVAVDGELVSRDSVNQA